MLARSQRMLAEKVSAVNLFANVRSEAPRSSPLAVSIFSCYQMRRKFPHSFLLLKHLLHDERSRSVGSTRKSIACRALIAGRINSGAQFMSHCCNSRGAPQGRSPIQARHPPNAIDFPLRSIQLPRSIYLNTPASSGASLLSAESYSIAEDCFEI